MVFYITKNTFSETCGVPDIFIKDTDIDKLKSYETRNAILKAVNKESVLIGTLGILRNEVFEDRKIDELPMFSLVCENGGTSYENRL